MPITVTNSPKSQQPDCQGTWVAVGQLTIAGLSEGANVINHGIGFTPDRLNFRPRAGGLWGETSPATATQMFITVGAGGATSGVIDYEGRPGL